MTHYHVITHPDDEDGYTTDDLFAAVDYAGDELDRLADFEHDGISASGEQGDYESAYNAFVRMERYNGLMLNAANMVKQHNAKRGDRAPIYRPSWKDQGTEEADTVLFQSAKHVVQMINEGSPLSIWECCNSDDAENGELWTPTKY
jgi:hypothetical protein